MVAGFGLRIALGALLTAFRPSQGEGKTKIFTPEDSVPPVQCHHGAVYHQTNFTVAPSSAYVFSVNSQSRSAWLKERSCRACNQFTPFRAPSLFTVALRVHSWRTPRDSLRIFCDRTSTEFPGHRRYVFFAHPLSRSVDGQRSPPRSPVSLHWIPLDIDKFPKPPCSDARSCGRAGLAAIVSSEPALADKRRRERSSRGSHDW